MAETIQYTVVQGERWDTISHKMYGTPYLFNKIIDANPTVPISDRLPAGLVLDIPIMEENSVTLSQENLPPWKRQSLT